MDPAPKAKRPYPAPTSPHLMHMDWDNLLFLHWPYKPSAIQELLPPSLIVDDFEGEAWIGIVPFLMNRVRHRLLPPIPGTSNFPELNVRTYVRPRSADGPAGVWFFSLDAANRLAVRGARALFHLPYFDARMTCTREGGIVNYSSTRTHRNAAPAEFRARYSPIGAAINPTEGTLEDFLTGRYCLYAAKPDGTLLRGEIDHDPWPIAPAEMDCEVNTMLDQLNLKPPETPPLLHHVEGITTKGWSTVVESGKT